MGGLLLRLPSGLLFGLLSGLLTEPEDGLRDGLLFGLRGFAPKSQSENKLTSQ